MTEAEAIEAITQRWIDAWPGLQPAVPYTFTNEAFDAVDNWARVTVLHTSRVQVTAGAAGSRKFEVTGRIQVQLFGSLDVGERSLALMAGHVRTVLEGRRIGDDVVTHAAASRETTTDGRWAMKIVSVPFRYHDTR